MTRIWLIFVATALVAGCGDPGPAPLPDAGPLPVCAFDIQCTNGVFCDGEERCDPSSPGADERGCVTSIAPACSTTLSCDEAARTCIADCAVARDVDGDGHDAIACGGDDCDDSDANRFPGNPEVCDEAGHDEDCVDTTFGSRDGDRDGYVDAACCNGTACGDDCDDTNAAANRAASEACDGVDNDCDGTTDEEVSTTFYPDADGDGYGGVGTTGMTMVACAAPVGFSRVATDCQDDDGAQNPAAFDRCEGANDDDCTDAVDDPAGGCDCEIGSSRACPLLGACGQGTQLCVAGAWGGCSVSAVAETCNGVDDDCNGVVDEGCACEPGSTIACGSSIGQCEAGVQLCTRDGAYGPCLAGRGPESEVCNLIDDDCDGAVDEGLPTTAFYIDRDGDGVGEIPEFGAPTVQACRAPEGYSATGGDCFDQDPTYRCEGTVKDLPGFEGEVLAAEDLDGDGAVEIIGFDRDAVGFFTLLRRTSAAGIADATFQVQSGSAPASVTHADTHPTEGVLLAAPSGIWRAREDATAGLVFTSWNATAAQDARFADMNGDGTVEIAALTAAGTLHIEALGATALGVSVASDVAAIVVANVDADAGEEVVGITFSGGLFVVHDGLPVTVIPSFMPQIPQHLVAADLTGDGAPELISGSSGGLNIATNAFAEGTGFVLTTAMPRLAVPNLLAYEATGDERVDILMSFSDLAVFRNASQAGDPPVVTLEPQENGEVRAGTLAIIAADVDGDGDDDVLATSGEGLSWVERREGSFFFAFRSLILG